jgi:hypothetical protein
MVPSGRIPQAKPGRSRILYRKPGPPAGGSGGAEAKEEKARSRAVAHAPAGLHNSTSVHVNSEPLAALSGMTAVALPWVSQRVPHQPFPFGCLGVCHGR